MTSTVMVEKVRIRWGLIRDCGPMPPFEGIIVEDLDGNRVQDIPSSLTEKIVHAAVGEPLPITHYVRVEGEDQNVPLVLLVMANEIPEAKRKEIMRVGPLS